MIFFFPHLRVRFCLLSLVSLLSQILKMSLMVRAAFKRSIWPLLCISKISGVNTPRYYCKAQVTLYTRRSTVY